MLPVVAFVNYMCTVMTAQRSMSLSIPRQHKISRKAKKKMEALRPERCVTVPWEYENVGDEVGMGKNSGVF
jgi:hypothetical protein